MMVRGKLRTKVCFSKGCNVEFETAKPSRLYCNGEECNSARAKAKKLEIKVRQRGQDGKFMVNAAITQEMLE